MDNRAIHFEPSQSFQEGATFALAGEGLIVSVAEEKALDSYNSTFECSLTMSRAQALQLRDWLNRHFPENTNASVLKKSELAAE